MKRIVSGETWSFPVNGDQDGMARHQHAKGRKAYEAVRANYRGLFGMEDMMTFDELEEYLLWRALGVEP